MISEKIIGKVYVVGDDINTDLIIPARFLTTMDPKELAPHTMEDLDPKEYPERYVGPDGVSEYPIIVAGKNFGCGSSREHAPIALHAAGTKAVVGTSFARIYYRNSINGGREILPIESYDDLSKEFKIGNGAEIDTVNLTITNLTTNKEYNLKSFGPVKKIIEAGGLTAYNKQRLGLK